MGSLGTLSKPLQAQPGSSAGVWGPPGADVSSIIASAANQPEVLVDYRILYEVHGSFDPWDTDNASLVVIAIDPFPTDRGRQFLRLSVRVSALAVPDENVQGDGARRNDVVRIEAFEPSSREQPVYVWATNEARRSLASLQPGASREKPSTAHTSKPERTHMLRVKSGWETANNGYGYASWEVSAAEKARGIGDSFTVAVLVRRPSGARFRLALAVNGDAGTFCRKALEFLPSDLSEERPWVTSGTFPSSAAGGKVPRGVCAGDLHHALLDNALEVLEEIGLVDPGESGCGALACLPARLRSTRLRSTMTMSTLTTGPQPSQRPTSRSMQGKVAQ
ncbi:hypothetical protein GGS23DRAFT_145793 [Durotheca rogersii]|uniref:uncharacterized protein n=1 Tax=Durotheca rogersii TaxID=419775 RepID=UPI00221EE63B|nr:uncharacterized protein GGS23DRAFT_145793 [Durotheca rogersii]KAI5861310.1 hypothetical protein GGS23DRAFT_145793 [Durotheca rogersii]